ncbi:uncharacterized protein LOC143066711 [Mytilus galloprovincialis]|uniref:uncharacterized protein LOC143066711 n=1 Tax=Mytilus galloprovincialis TaxID=29158 RepID=UPI003F7B3D94
MKFLFKISKMDVRITNIYVLFYFIVYNVIPISGRYCYSRYYYYYTYGYYYYCNSYSYLSVGTIAGAVIGGIIGLVIIIAIVVVICASCCKSHGSRGTVVQPYPTTRTVHTITTVPAYNHPPPQNNMYYSQYPPNVYSLQPPNTSMAYPPPMRPHMPPAPPPYPSSGNRTNTNKNTGGSLQRQQNMPAIPENVPVEPSAPGTNVSPANGAIITGAPPTGTNLPSTSGIPDSDPPPYPGTVSNNA